MNSTISLQFKKTEGSLPCSQQPATAVHPEADRSISRPSSRSAYNSFNVILTVKPGLPGDVLPRDFFSTKAVYTLLLSPICAICPPISFLIWPLRKKHLTKLMTEVTELVDHSPHGLRVQM